MDSEPLGEPAYNLRNDWRIMRVRQRCTSLQASGIDPRAAADRPPAVDNTR
jgi:hypothetical protein